MPGNTASADPESPQPAAPILTLVINPIEAAKAVDVPAEFEGNPAVGNGWRWAVYAGRADITNLATCMNAGWGPSKTLAAFEGEQLAATVVKCLRAYGVEVQYGQLVLEYDPIPAGADFVSIF